MARQILGETSVNTFNDMALPAPLKRALEKLQFNTPTPIQSAAISLAMEGKDLVGSAQTGSGKTAAFCLPSLAKILSKPDQRILVLAPTRELALQIKDVARDLSQFCSHIRLCLLIGGASMGAQFKNLRGQPNFVVATPGRLLDHFKRKSIHLKDFETIILDEADRMLDMGFAPAINQILAELPQERQTLLFSATLPPQILKMTKDFMKSPEWVEVKKEKGSEPKIEITTIEVPGAEKNERILAELSQRHGSILVFARTKIRTDRLAKFLNQSGLKASAIHGGRSQSQRLQALRRFRDGDSSILVATDVASRGIDIPSIGLVVNFDLPQTREDYIHRIGRTARAGASGEALSFITPEEKSHWRMLTGEKSQRSQRFERSDRGSDFQKRRPFKKRRRFSAASTPKSGGFKIFSAFRKKDRAEKQSAQKHRSAR